MLKQTGFKLEHNILTIKEVQKLRKEAKKYIDGGAPFWIAAMNIVQSRSDLDDRYLQSVLNNSLDDIDKREIKRIL